MFCPKCGNQLPDGAVFCGACGNKIEAAAQPKKVATRASSGKGTGASGGVKTAGVGGGISTAMIVTLVIGIVAIIFACLPWLDINPALQSLSGGAASVSSFFTGTSAYAPALEDSYSVFGFLGLSQDMQAYGNLLGNTSTFGTLSLIFMVTFVAWLIAMILTIVGLIQMFISQGAKKGLLRVGATVLALVALFWSVLAMVLVSESGLSDGFNFNPVICLIASIVLTVCTGAVKKSS